MRFATLLLTGLTLGLCHLHAVAAPQPLAVIDRSTWPEKLQTPAAFDVASRAEVLQFASALKDSEALSEEQIADRLDLRTVNMASINVLRAQLWTRLWRSFDQAQQSCDQDASFCFAIDSQADLQEQAAAYVVPVDSFYATWSLSAKAFDEAYLDELLHAAALSPQISSEVLRLNDTERNGDELNDRVFLLTFDGGPTPPQGHTDWLVDYLRRQKMSATFFVLGNSFANRRDNPAGDDLPALYQDQCVGVEGWEYRNHSVWQDWQDSIQRSVALVQGELPDSYVPLFRPPYGQRRGDAQNFFAGQNLQVALWDIDSQDGSGRMTAEQSAQRVLTLMLLWRRGIVLFHDAQDKAQTALPWLLAQTAQSGIGWQPCKQFQ
ncbi:polysaccharide deacetylase family protein [Pseudomonas sp. dw_358]|uniref:polysaccharide deacetylase family protein n=1 Tax=Pseudomonas sp. dw_358 TaxID=2720083 RepID=UPI002116F4A0|nr:polysaccharide deacetylase family protein [Pseudomonas sp. dw_358]